VVVEEPAPPLDAKKQAAFNETLSDARFSMSERDLAAARRHLRAAETKVQTPADRAEFARLQAMLGHLEGFWEAMRQGISQLVGGQELALKTTRVAVVEASRDRLTLIASGTTHSWLVEAVPTSVVKAIARDSFLDDAASKVQFGAFLVVDPDGDRDYARQLWAEAAAEGLDVKQLMPELSEALP